MFLARISAGVAFIAALGALASPAFADTLAADPSAQVAASVVSNVTVELPLEQALLEDTNADRAANGVPALEFDSDTLAIARARASAQIGPNSLSHYDGDGQLAFVRLLASANVPYTLAGENLARSSATDSSVVTRMEQALMQSPLHRKNILDPSFARVAIGEATSPSGQIAFAEIFRGGD